MAPKNNSSTRTSTSSSSQLPCSVPTLFLAFTSLCTLSLFLFFFLFTSSLSPSSTSSLLSQISPSSDSIKVYVADLPRSLNYALLDTYWSSASDSRLATDADAEIRLRNNLEFPTYPENPLIKQYSAEYWILGDLMTPSEQRTTSFSKRVSAAGEADVVFVPFFATLSAEMQLGRAKGLFRKKVGNEDYQRHREVVDFVKNSEAWKRSGGRDHVFVLTGYVKS